MRSSAVSGGLQRGHHAAPVLVLRTVEQFWLYLQACYALEVDKDWPGAVLDDIRLPSAASWPQRNKRSRSAQSSNVAPGPVVADALRRHVLLPDAIYPGFATLWM